MGLSSSGPKPEESKIMNDPTFSNAQERDFDQPVVSIGSHQDNDIILTGTGVLPFHATVVLEAGQYRLIPAEAGSETRVDGILVRDPHVQLEASQRVEIGTHALFFQDNGTPNNVHVILYSTSEEDIPEEFFDAGSENAILINLISSEVEVEVDQSALFEFEVVNAGPIVARFSISLRGVPEKWVEINPSIINLNEGKRHLARIQVTPPRDPESEAGTHTLQVVVTSPNYGGQRAVADLSLTIQPFYDFSLGSLSPKSQRISWRKRTGMTHLSIINQGNSLADFSLLAMDDEGGCSFDFLINEDLELNRQANTKLYAGEAVEIPIQITPFKNPMFAMRSKRYHYTTNVQIPQQISAPQILSGSVKSVPLFGWWSIMLGLASVLLALFFILQPNIRSFDVAAGKDVIELGDTTKLLWDVSPFSTRLSLSNIDQPIERGQVSQTVAPSQSMTYELLSGNWLSSTFGLDQKQTVTVLVVPPSPQVNVFDVDRRVIATGQSINIRWSVSEADEVLLTIDEVVYPLSVEEYSGEQEVFLENDALITLEAKNASGSELQSHFVNVVPPNIIINAFTVWVRTDETAMNPGLDMVSNGSTGGKLFSKTNAPDPSFPVKFVSLVPEPKSDNGYKVQTNPNIRDELEKGEQIVLEWDIEGAEALQIAPFEEALPARGNRTFFPQESMTFLLTAQSGDLEGIFMLPVKVFDGEPPEAPTIDFFEASPSKIVGKGDVEFAWSISGEWTYIQIVSGETIIGDYLNAQGFKTVVVEETSSFILTAWNGADLSSSKIIEVVVDPALKPVDLTITEVLPEITYFRVGDSINVFVELIDPETGENPDPYPAGDVIISDGRAICTIKLPTRTCKLTFNAAGTKIDDDGIKASYAGDDIYLPATSEVFSDREIIVEANQVDLNPTYYHLEQDGSPGAQINSLSNPTPELIVGRGLRIDVNVTPINKPFDEEEDNGQVTVRYCPLENGEVQTQDCITVLPATVEFISADAGIAEINIQHFSKVGHYALLIDYTHSDGAYAPVSLGGDGSISFDIEKGILALIPDGIPTCNTEECTLTEGAPEYIFNPHLFIETIETSWLEVLTSTYLEPGKLEVKLRDPVTLIEIADWTDDCQWQKSGDHWQLYCDEVNLTEDVILEYSFIVTDPNYKIDPDPHSIDITTKLSTLLDFPNADFLDDKFVGMVIELQPDNVILEKADDGTPIDGDIELTLEVGGVEAEKINDYLIVTSASTNCSASGATLTISQDKDATPIGNCQIAFKKTGEYTLHFEFDGNDDYSGTIANKTFTVAKQRGIEATWTNIINTFTWEIFSSNDVDLDFECPTATASCADFDDDILIGATLRVDFDLANGCSSTSHTDGELSLSSTTETLTFRCTELGSKTLGLDFIDESINDFNLESGDTQSLTINQLTKDISSEVRINNNGVFEDYPLADDRVSNPVPTWDIIQALYVDEEYWVVVTLSGMPSDDSIEPDSTDTIKMVWPSALDSAMDKAKSSCDEKWDTSTNAYKIPLEKSAADPTIWVAKCKVRFSSTASLNPNAKIQFSLPDSNRIASIDREIDLPNGVIKDDVIIVTDFIDGYEQAANAYYTLSAPKVKITFDDNHYQANVEDNLVASMIEATINRGSGSEALTCTKQADGSITCVLPDNTAWNSEVTVVYDGSSTVFANTTEVSDLVTLVAIPVDVQEGDLKWIDSGAEKAFPEEMLCSGCIATSSNTPADSPWYFITQDTYTVRVPVLENTGDAYNPVVDQGELTITFTGGSAKQYSQTVTVIDGLAEFTLDFSANGREHEWGKYYTQIELLYTNANAFSDNNVTIDKGEDIHRQNRITFTEDWFDDYKAVDIVITSPMPGNTCHDVYIQSDTTLTCEGDQDCWHLDDPDPEEKVAVYCNGGDDTWIAGGTYHNHADDERLVLNNSINERKYQIFLWSRLFIGYNKVDWP